MESLASLLRWPVELDTVQTSRAQHPSRRRCKAVCWDESESAAVVVSVQVSLRIESSESVGMLLHGGKSSNRMVEDSNLMSASEHI
jgi:hypothetical protein